jgi:hypothetical protein
VADSPSSAQTVLFLYSNTALNMGRGVQILDLRDLNFPCIAFGLWESQVVVTASR